MEKSHVSRDTDNFGPEPLRKPVVTHTPDPGPAIRALAQEAQGSHRKVTLLSSIIPNLSVKMNDGEDYDEGHADSRSTSQNSSWLRIAMNPNIDYEDGSSNSQGHFVTKSEVDSSDEQASGEEMSMRNGFDLSKKSRNAASSMNDGFDGSATLIPCKTDDQYFLSGSSYHSGNSFSPNPEEVSRKREMRLLKNKEAAKECRRKKKEYVKCLENRVMVLELQNKTLIDELKALKELYCQRENK